MRQTINLNNQFTYCPSFELSYLDAWQDFPKVRIPHTNIELPLNYFSEELYQFISVYQLRLDLRDYHQRAVLVFEGNAGISEVYANGQLRMVNRCWYNAFSVDLSDLINQEVLICVKLDSREDPEVPPFGKVVDYLTYGGIYRNVYLEINDVNYIDDIFVTSSNDLVDVSVKVHATSGYQLALDIMDQELVVYHDTLVDQSQWQAITWSNLERWSLTNPYLYQAKLTLIVHDQEVDVRRVQFGVREIEFSVEGFKLNGERVKLLGLNRHQSYPYVGYAMPKRQQAADAKLLKTMGCNIVRTAHYMQSQEFITACDELGLLVFTEIPGWQHLGGSELWRNQTVANVESMVMQYRNHPSIVLWGVRINESNDDHELYTLTNELCHRLDPSRMTSGVRYIEKSELLEDVYAFNDFSHVGDNAGISPPRAVIGMNKPYLISEHNGHMNPTKSFDHELQRLSQAMRHRKVIEDALRVDQVSGVIGWAFADYNTHKDFGSGDRICYHGVLDIHRMPKLASTVYATFNPDRVVLQVGSMMNIGEYPGGFIGPIKVFTNCDYLKLYKNDVYISTFYQVNHLASNALPGLIIVDDMIGQQLMDNESFSPSVGRQVTQVMRDLANYGLPKLPWKSKLNMAWLLATRQLTFAQGYQLYGEYVSNWGEKNVLYRFDGYQGNQQVISVSHEPMSSWRLKVTCDTQELIEGDTYDVAKVDIQCLDQHGNLLSYAQFPLHLEVDGVVAMVGPELRVMHGGQCAVYVKTKAIGVGRLMITCPDHELVVVDFTVKGEYDVSI